MSSASCEELFVVVTGPEVGGGGVLGPSVFRVTLFFFKRTSLGGPAPEGGGGGFLKKAADRVNRAFQPVRGSENRSFPGRRKPSGEARGFPLISFPNDSIGARRLVGTFRRSKRFVTSWFPWDRKTFVSVAPAAGPSPSEAAMYDRASESASGFFEAGRFSHGLRIDRRRSQTRSACGYIGAQALGLLGGLGDLAFDHVADGDDAD